MLGMGSRQSQNGPRHLLKGDKHMLNKRYEGYGMVVMMMCSKFQFSQNFSWLTCHILSTLCKKKKFISKKSTHSVINCSPVLSIDFLIIDWEYSTILLLWSTNN